MEDGGNLNLHSTGNLPRSTVLWLYNCHARRFVFYRELISVLLISGLKLVCPNDVCNAAVALDFINGFLKHLFVGEYL